MAKKILIVDDDPNVVKVLASRLRANKYEVMASSDGLQAVQKAHQGKPDLIILDIRMPAGSGISVAEKLKISDDTSLIPVIVITGYPDEEIQQKAQEMGAAHFITKPVHAEELLAKVEEILGE